MPNGPRRPPLVTVQHQEENRYSPRRSSYNLYRQRGNGEYSHGITLEVAHEPDKDAYYYPPVSGVSRGFSGTTHPHLTEQAYNDMEDAEYVGKPKLFGHAHESGESTITYLESTKEARAHTLTLGVLADEDTLTSPGREMQFDTDRSGYSERLVQNLGNKLGTQFSARKRQNDLGFVPESPHTSSLEGLTEGRPAVSEGRVETARLKAREIAAGGPKLGPKKPEHEQLSLF